MIRPNRVPSAALGLLGLLSVGLPAAAQATGLLGIDHWAQTGLVSSAKFGRTASGDFDADGVRDLVVLRGSALEVLLAPGLFDVRLSLPQSVQGFGVYRTKGVEPRDLILAATPSGLIELRLDPANSTWSSQVIAASWSDARLLEVHDMGSAVAVIGVKPDGKSVSTLFLVDGVWFEQPLVTLPQIVTDLAVAQFDGVGQIEIVVAMPNALTVFDAAGKLRWFWAPPDVKTVAIGRLVQPNSPCDWLAWMVTRSNGMQDLLVTSQGGIHQKAGLSSVPSIVDMETGDLDGDGNSDIVLSHIQQHHAVVFLDSGNGQAPLFDYSLPNALQLLPIGPANTPAPDNRARPTLSDIDGDGDTDLLMPVQSTGEIFLWRNGLVDGFALAPHVEAPQPELAANLVAQPDGDLTLELELVLDLPASIAATHVELIAWRRAEPGLPTGVAAVERVLLPLPGSGAVNLQASLTLPAPPDMVPGTNVRFEGMYLWLQRAVRVENGKLLQCWPALVYALETSPSPGNYSWIKSLGGKMMFPVHEQQNGTSLPDLIGCGSEMPNLPDFPGGKVPTWN